MEHTSQAVQTAAPTVSAMPTSVAPNSASQYATNAPSTYQASVPQVGQPAPAQMQQPQAYQQQAAPQASVGTPAAQANPWQQAFQALSASLNTPSQSQAQAQYSAYQTPTPQASTQAAWASQAPQVQYQQAPQTYSAQASTPAYSAQEVQGLLQQQAAQIQSQAVSQSGSDSYLQGISDTSLEVLEHFGAEAPGLLNQYACAVEDALIEQVQRGQSLNLMLNAAGEERSAMNIMLTDPDILADYVNDFYGPNGPYPTETPAETAEREHYEARAQFEAEIQSQEQRSIPPNFRRPEMDMPTPGQRATSPQGEFWGDFSEMMDTNPEQAWQYLAQAPQGAFQAKALIQDL